MLVLHHLQLSQSERITWLLEELGLEYKLVVHVRDPVQSPQSLRSLPGNETGKAPFLEDPVKNITLSESAAIVEYIIQMYGNGRLALRPGDKNYADYLYWFHYANGSLQSEMMHNMFLNGSGAPADDQMRALVRARMDAAWKHLDDRLKNHKFLAGDEFTAADIMTVYSPTTQRYFGPQDDLSAYTNLLRWLKDVTDRQGFRKAMEKGDPEMKSQIEGPSPPNIVVVGGAASDAWKK